MTSTSPSEIVYEGELVIADFDPEKLEALSAELEDFVELEEGEELVVSLPGGERLEVAKLRERSE
jgi:hypothetical protein